MTTLHSLHRSFTRFRSDTSSNNTLNNLLHPFEQQRQTIHHAIAQLHQNNLIHEVRNIKSLCSEEITRAERLHDSALSDRDELLTKLKTINPSEAVEAKSLFELYNQDTIAEQKSLLTLLHNQAIAVFTFLEGELSLLTSNQQQSHDEWESAGIFLEKVREIVTADMNQSDDSIAKNWSLIRSNINLINLKKRERLTKMLNENTIHVKRQITAELLSDEISHFTRRLTDELSTQTELITTLKQKLSTSLSFLFSIFFFRA